VLDLVGGHCRALLDPPRSPETTVVADPGRFATIDGVTRGVAERTVGVSTAGSTVRNYSVVWS
jgi:hypothetical protein